MGVYIKGMEMPTSCAVCPFENYGDCYGGKVKAIMDIDDYVSAGKRHPKCPLVPVPPHGRLIDADALMQSLGITNMECDKCAWCDSKWGRCMRGGDFEDSCCAIEDAPTIIEAEEGE